MDNHSLLASAVFLLVPLAACAAQPLQLQQVLGPPPVGPEHPTITPAPAITEWHPTRTINRRGLLDDVQSGVGSALQELGSNIPSEVASGVANFFQNFPTKDKVQSSLGIDDDQVRALPTQVLNIPGYGNWTENGWNLRVHGNVYKQPNTDQKKLDELANGFLVDTSVEELPQSQADQARNLTASIFVLQQENLNVTFDLKPAPTAGASGEQGGGGAVTPPGGDQSISLKYKTTDQGDFDEFVYLNDTGFFAGNATQDIQRLDVYAQGASIGNATAYLVPQTGLTVISDIDDILRVTKIYKPKEGLLNSFARPFTQWENMPDIYSNWSQSIEGVHFHYLTTTPEQVTRNYMDFIYKTYPGGSFDTRPLNFSDVSATLSIRAFLLNKIFQTYPQRKFVLVADTSNSDVMKAYPQMAKDYKGQVTCILLRNTSSTDPDDKFPYDTSGFKDLDNKTYMFFNNPDDLRNINFANGGCVNSTVQQHVTFSYQGLPFGLSKDNGAGTIGMLSTWVLGAAMGLVVYMSLAL